ncbi:MAG: DUF4097 domain-containing protein [Candidatus Sabulitectum sp.]|nr:DUF4097 domain-containing protein [Candidatus Sabulitectum sp.]
MKYKMFLLSAACLAVSCITIKVNRDLLEIRTGEFEVEAGSGLSFENTNGDLEVREWELDFVQIETFIYGDSGSGVPPDLNIRFEELEDHLSAVVDYPGGIGISFCSVNFIVMIPDHMGYTINHTTTNGETLIIGDVIANVESTNGDIYVEATCSHYLETTNGDITALLSGQNGVLVAETTNGDVSVEIPDIIGFEAETVNGEIVFEGVKMDDQAFIDGDWIARIETTNGDISVTRINVR